MYDSDYPASIHVSIQIPSPAGHEQKPISQSFTVILPLGSHIANGGARHWNAIDTELAAVIALTWRGLDEIVTSERSSTGSLQQRSLGDNSQRALAVILHCAKSVSDDVVLFAGAQRHDSALARCRKLFECWLHAGLLEYLGDDAADIFLSHDHHAARSLRQARTADSALRGDGSQPLTPLAKPARRRLTATGLS